MEHPGKGALWDRRYEEGLPSLTRPDPFFVSTYERFVAQSFPNAGRALDLAAGLGRHTLWLADKAWQVSAVDVSGIAMGKLAQAAGPLKVNLDLFVIDAAEYAFEPAGFDLIVLFYHLDRRLFSKIVSALNPGGLFICKLTLRWGTETETALAKGNFIPLDRNELLSLVPGLQVLDHRERPVRDRGVVEFVGRNPLM